MFHRSRNRAALEPSRQFDRDMQRLGRVINLVTENQRSVETAQSEGSINPIVEPLAHQYQPTAKLVDGQELFPEFWDNIAEDD